MQQQQSSLDQEEEGLISKAFTIAQFEEMIISGAIKDATSINAYNIARLKGFIN